MNQEKLNQFIISEDASLPEAMKKIDANGNGILFVADGEGRLAGTASDGDIRRWILRTGSIEGDVAALMNPSPKFVTEDARPSNPLEYMTGHSIRALPVVDASGRVADIFLAKELEKPAPGRRGGLEGVTVVVMAGGRGTRLYPYTKILPKPLIPIGEVPIVERILAAFHAYGADDFVLTVNYKKNMIKSYFAELSPDYRISYVEEEKALGTAGSLRLVRDVPDAPLVVTNCDTLIRMDYGELYAHHLRSGNAVTVVAAVKNERIPYGVICAKEDGEIDRIVEKPVRSYLVNTGLYVLDPGLIALIPEGSSFHMTDLCGKAMEGEYKVGMYPVGEEAFLDMGEMEEMKKMEEKIGALE